MKSCENTIT